MASSLTAFCSLGIELSVNAQLTRKIKDGSRLAPTCSRLTLALTESSGMHRSDSSRFAADRHRIIHLAVVAVYLLFHD